VLECDRVVVEHVTRTDQPHLIVRPRAGGVVVGPLVLPGRTACLRCTDLARRDADPVWPTMLAQLQRTSMSVTPALTGWAAGVAAAQALAFLGGSTPETHGATLEICPTDYVTHRRPWAMHPACGCGWRATAQ
jgi:bacteriocin biosynthesis cyclodehydratase domain-containing protein